MRVGNLFTFYRFKQINIRIVLLFSNGIKLDLGQLIAHGVCKHFIFMRLGGTNEEFVMGFNTLVK